MSELSEIKSRDNEKLRFARRVRDGKENGYMFVEGSRLSRECLRSNVEIEFGLVSYEFRSSDIFGGFEQNKRFPFFVVSEKLLESVADTKNPQGIVLIARRAKDNSVQGIFETLGKSLPILVYLYRINNPSNLGAVIRTAEAAGISGVVVSPNSTDPFSPKSLRASMGSAFRLPIGTDVEMEEMIDSARINEVEVVVVDASGTASHIDHDWKRKTLLVFGSEADGLPNEIISRANAKLRIEMNSEVESLNLAVSCGIVLFEAKRQLTG